ncbi:MFS transporter [Streptomyces phytohabitans]|uniref:MFS transporter n=1 Tax=Streptomyces phytohabitans TaxID=1150371 RepID=UPI00345C2A9C
MRTAGPRTEPDTRPPSSDPAALRRWALVVLALAQLMVVLDATIVNVALPSTQQDLGFSDSSRQWVVTAYALTFGSLLLLGGRLSDLFGRRRMLQVGFAGFALASALGGAAGGIGTLVAARAAQGAFAAVLAPAALSLLSTTFTTPADRARAFGVYGSVTGSGSAIGLLLGGSLTEYASWRWCLLINVVFAAVGLVGAVVKLEETSERHRAPMDWPGVATAAAGLASVVYGLGNAEADGWSAPGTYGFLSAGVLLLIGFVAWERRAASPLLPMRVVRDRTRGGAYLAVALTGSGMFGLFLFLTYYLTTVLGLSPLRTGLAFLPAIVAIMVSALLVGRRFVPRTGPRPLVTLGALVAACGMAHLARLDLHSDYATGVLPGLVLTGLGMGLVFSPTQNAATFGVRPHDAGVASAMVNTAQQIGGATGTAFLSWVAASAASAHTEGGAPGTRTAALAAIHGYQAAFWTSAGLFVACALVSAVTFRGGPLKSA